ncbi:hypothetical protein Lser_V15G34808 [Lactuca serriola]
MRTTSKSEAENYFYGLLSNSDLHLIEFSTHFDTTLEGQRCIQRKNDHDSRYTKPNFKTRLKLEVEEVELFTGNAFFDIQSEIVASMVSCMSIRLEESEELKTLTIKDIDKHPQRHGQFEVELFKSDQKLLSSRFKIELTGI